MRQVSMLALFHITFFLLSCGGTESESQLNSWWQKKYDTQKNLFIPSFDGTSLVAILQEPKEKYFPGQRPAIIFANSWTLDEKEYQRQAEKFASRGYIVLSYATRGFGRSEGLVSGAGPDDIKDVSSMIDWLENNTNVDSTRIGMSGVSYGGGIALLALAEDERLFTVAALSSWSDMEKSLYGGETLRKVWIDLLLGSAGEGRVDPEFHQIYENLKNRSDIEGARSWAIERSSSHRVDQINSKGSPVFLANSYRDNLFPPNQSLDFFERLTGVKRFYMNKGIHASAEMSGIIGLGSSIWNEVHEWFDHWLLEPGLLIDKTAPYALQTDKGRDFFTALPSVKSKDSNVKLKPINKIVEVVTKSERVAGVRISTAKDSGASLGIPIVGSVLDSHTPIKIRKWLPRIKKENGAVFVADKFNSDRSIRGVSRVEFNFIPESADVHMVAYLYDVNSRGMATLVTHGVISLYDLTTNTKNHVSLDMTVSSHDFKEGKKLALVIDGYDSFYKPIDNKESGFTIIHDGADTPQIFLPEP